MEEVSSTGSFEFVASKNATCDFRLPAPRSFAKKTTKNELLAYRLLVCKRQQGLETHSINNHPIQPPRHLDSLCRLQQDPALEVAPIGRRVQRDVAFEMIRYSSSGEEAGEGWEVEEWRQVADSDETKTCTTMEVQFSDVGVDEERKYTAELTVYSVTVSSASLRVGGCC